MQMINMFKDFSLFHMILVNFGLYTHVYYGLLVAHMKLKL